MSHYTNLSIEERERSRSLLESDSSVIAMQTPLIKLTMPNNRQEKD